MILMMNRQLLSMYYRFLWPVQHDAGKKIGIVLFWLLCKMEVVDDSDAEQAALVHVFSFFVASYNMNAQACALAMELQDLNDDNLPGGHDGFSVNVRLPVTNILEEAVSGPSSIFYNLSGFTIEDWRVRVVYFVFHLINKDARNCLQSCVLVSK